VSSIVKDLIRRRCVSAARPNNPARTPASPALPPSKGKGAAFALLAFVIALPAHAQETLSHHTAAQSSATLGVLSTAGQAPDPALAPAASLRDRTVRGSAAYDVLESLTTEIGPRPAGSPAMARAKDWALAKLNAMGFSNVHAEPFAIWAWFKGTETAEVTDPFPQPLVITGLGGSVATPPPGVEGEIVLFKTWQDLLAAKPGSLEGKIAVLTQRMGPLDSPTGYEVANRWRRKGASEAARRGAVGFLIRSLATNDLRDPHSGALNYDDDARKIPAAALSGPDADQLERMVDRNIPIKVKFTLVPTYLPDAKSWNVVGEIPGASLPSQVVLVSAHLDSWGLGTGAIDDGAGAAIVMTAAQLAATQKPARTIRVVLWGAEETNQAGPEYFKAHADELSDIALAGEADFGADKVLSFQAPKGAADLAPIKTLMATLAPLGVSFNPTPAAFGGDDITPLYQAGVPVISLRQDGTHYFDWHHSMNDTLDKVDPKALDQAVAAWTAAIYATADTDVSFRVKP